MQASGQIDDLQYHLTDASNMQGGHAEELFRPASTAEVSEILVKANADKTAVTIAGARTGTVGGAIPFGGWVVSLEKLNKIDHIDRASLTARVGAGVILADLQRAVEAEGLFYPPDPTEWSCQIGGTVATNASGARSFKYGATREYIKGLTVVLATSDVVRLRRSECLSKDGSIIITAEGGREYVARVPTYERPQVRKNVSGYFNLQPLDAVDMFIGSEGTLGVITGVELGLLPKPDGFFSGIVFFPQAAGLLAFVAEARAMSHATRVSGDASLLQATLIEYFDERALAFISEKFPETPDGMAGAIFFEQDTTAETEDGLLEAWNDLLEKHRADLERSWFTTNEADREKMRSFRHALPVAVNERVARNGRLKVGTDMAVPDNAFPGFLAFCRQMLDASGLDHVTFGHIGDCHLHSNMLPKTEAESITARHIYGRFAAQAIMLGGTVSAEHGIGKLKRKYLYAMMGERYLNEMAELKRVFDPNAILGRGNMFEEKYL